MACNKNNSNDIFYIIFSVVFISFFAGVTIISVCFKKNINETEYNIYKNISTENITTIILTPLLDEYSHSVSTIEKEIVINNKQIISIIHNEMLFKHKVYELTGHFFTIKQLQLTYIFNNNSKISFFIIINTGESVAAYYFKQKSWNYFSEDDGDNEMKGSQMLCKILLEVVKKNTRWQNSNIEFWELNDTPKYVGEKKTQGSDATPR